MGFSLSDWLKKRVDDVEGAFGVSNNRQSFKTNIPKPAPARTISQSRPQQTAARTQITAPKTTNDLVNRSYGSGFTGIVNRTRDVFDANTEADRIKRQAQTGLNETYDQQQKRLTARAQNDPTKRNLLQQVSGNALGGISEFAKVPSQALKMKGAIDQTPVGKALNFVNPATQTSAFGNELWKRVTGQDVAKKQSEILQGVGTTIEKNIDNRIQQSGLGNRNTDNRILSGVSRAGGQLIGQTAGAAATGGSTIPSIAMGLQTASGEYDKARQAGKNNDQAVTTALVQGGVSSALEKVGFDKLGAGKSALGRSLSGLVTEGVQEGTQQFAQNLIANKMYDPTQGLWQGVPESALIGGITGGLASPMMGRYGGEQGQQQLNKDVRRVNQAVNLEEVKKNLDRKLDLRDQLIERRRTLTDKREITRHNKMIADADTSIRGLSKRVDFLSKGGLSIMGMNATDFERQKRLGRVFEGVDGKPRFEVDDSGARIKNPNGKTLGELLDHAELFKNYPELQNLKVGRGVKGVEEAHYNPADDTINVGTKKVKLGDLLHETQHAIQEREGFAKGGNLSTGVNKTHDQLIQEVEKLDNELLAMVKNGADQNNPAFVERKTKLDQLFKQEREMANGRNPFEQYSHLAGEAEARAVQARMNMPMSERYKMPKTADDYAMSHRPDSEGATLDDISQGGEFVPEDVYTKPEWYGDVNDQATRESIAIIQKVRGNPEAEVTVYRAAPKNELNSGDWISLSKKYAVGESGVEGTKVHSFKVKAKELRWPGDSFNEFGYFPDSKPRSTFYDSLDVPKEDLIIRNDGGKAMSVEKDPLESLKQEARKYKSAEEFVGSKNAPSFELDKTRNQSISNLAEAARNAKSFEEFANGTYELPLKDLHGNTPRAANTPGKSRTPNAPVEAYIRQGRGVIDVTDGNHRLYEAADRGDQTVKVRFNDSTKKGNGHWGRLKDFYEEARGEKLSKKQLTDLYNQATQSQPPKSTPKADTKPKGLVVSKRKNRDGTITQKVRTGKGKVEERVVDRTLQQLERQKKQIVDSEAKAKYDASKQTVQTQKELRKEIRSRGGIKSSDYESIPKSLKGKNGMAMDDMATELGFENDQALYDELTTHTDSERLADLRDVVEDQVKNGNSPLSSDYKRLLQAIDDRKAELLRYPEGAKVIKNQPNMPTFEEFDALLKSAEAQNPKNKTKAGVTKATGGLRKQQFEAVIAGDTAKADKLRQQIGEIESGLDRNAPQVKREIETQQPTIKNIKDKQTKQQFETITKEYLGTKNSSKIERQAAIRSLEDQFDLTDAEKLNAIQALDSTTVKPVNDKVAKYVKEFRNQTDTAYRRYREAGVNMGYQSSYLPRIYQNPETGQLYDSAEFELLQRSSKRMRGREADMVNTDWLVEKDPTKLLERYYDSMDKAAAGRKYLDGLQNAGLITSSTEPVPGLRPIVAEGMQSDTGMTYYAPKAVANKLNTIFGSKETTNLVEKIMEKGAELNSLFQSFVLSGGIPNTPINSFGIMQVMKEGMALHPIKAAKAIGAGFNKNYADKYFRSRKDVIKLMAEHDIDTRVDLSETGKTGRQRVKEAFSESKSSGLNRAWDEFTNDATFKRFMPMLEIVHFENIYKKAYKQTGDQAKAAQIAADSVKNFYGKTGEYKQTTRSKVGNDAVGAVLFAPRFREAMVNFWGKNIKALNPQTYGKLEYRDNHKFLIAAGIAAFAMDALNEALNGVHMWDNPDDKKDKLIVPAETLKNLGINTDGKDIGVPFLSSIATVPRNAISGVASLATGDLESAAKRGKSFLSMPLNSAVDLLTNEDYFGNKIVKDDVKGLDRFTQMAAYTAGRNMQPWVREGLNKVGGNLPDDLKKKLGIKEKGTFETVSNALESPLRFYDPQYYKYGDTWSPRGGKDEKFTIAQQRERSKYKAQIDKIGDTLQLTAPQKQAYKTLNTYEFDNDGNIKLDNDPFYQAKRATAMQDDGVFEAMKQKNILENRLNGKPIDPIYNLTPSERRVILWKKTLPQGTSDPTIKQIYGQEWYQNYRGQEDKYFRDKLAYNEKMGYDNTKVADTNPYPQPSAQLRQKLDYYYTLPSGTGARSAFLKSNPDVLAQWDAVENWKNGERAMVGLGAIDSGGSKYASSRGGRKKGSKPDLSKLVPKTAAYTKGLQDLVDQAKLTGSSSSPKYTYKKAKLKGVRSI